MRLLLAAEQQKLYAVSFFRQDGRLDEADKLALETIDLIENKLLRNPDGFYLRGNLGTAYGLVGDRARMREEEARVRSDLGDAGQDLGTLADGEGMIGDKKRFVELRQIVFRAGNTDRSYRYVRALFADPMIEDYPGYKEFAAEADLEIKRLEALY